MLVPYYVSLVILSSSSAFTPIAPFLNNNLRRHASPASFVGSVCLETTRGKADNTPTTYLKKNYILTTKPYLASALEKSIVFVVRYILLRRCDNVSISIHASSNRNLFRGQIDDVSLSTRGCISRFNLLSLRRWDVNASNLQLGYLPFIIPLLPYLFWRLRFYFVIAWLVQLSGRQNPLQSIIGQLLYMLGARPSHINYSLVIDEDDINRSHLFRFGLRTVLRSLVQNSVLGAAASLVDDARNQGIPLLPGSSSDANTNQQQRGLSSTLLSATTFDLKKTSLSDGRVLLQALGTIPNDKAENLIGKRQMLPFTIRAKLEPASTTYDGENDALGFVDSDCRLNTNPLTTGTMLGRLIPDILWIPFGSGVIIPVGRSLRIHRADIARARDSDDREVCRIDGSWTAFATTKNELYHNIIITPSSVRRMWHT